MFEFDSFRAVFLHKVGARDRAFEIGLETQLCFEVRGRKSERLERRQIVTDVVTYERLDIGTRIVDDDIQSVCQEQRRPGRADDAGADDRRLTVATEDVLLGFRHDDALSLFRGRRDVGQIVVDDRGR